MGTSGHYGGLLMGDPRTEAVQAAIWLLLLLIVLSGTVLALAVKTVLQGRGVWRELVTVMTLLAIADVGVLAKWNALRQWADTATSGRPTRLWVLEPLAGACHTLLLCAAIGLSIWVLAAAAVALRDRLQDILVPSAAVAALVGRVTVESVKRNSIEDKDIR